MSIEIRAWPKKKENFLQWWLRIKVQKTDITNANTYVWYEFLFWIFFFISRYSLCLIQFSLLHKNIEKKRRSMITVNTIFPDENARPHFFIPVLQHIYVFVFLYTNRCKASSYAFGCMSSYNLNVFLLHTVSCSLHISTKNNNLITHWVEVRYGILNQLNINAFYAIKKEDEKNFNRKKNIVFTLNILLKPFFKMQSLSYW